MAKELSMNGRKKIGTLQREFTEKFNYLTIIFLDQEMRALDPGKSLAEVRTKKGPELSVVASLKVNTLEQRFLDDFGIHAEVSFCRDGKIMHTKDTLDKSLNELNSWCAENGCEPIQISRSASAGAMLSIQEQLFERIRSTYPDASIKKINTDNFVDIHLPSIHAKKGTHLFFNTAKNEIKLGFFVRDEKFLSAVLSAGTSVEQYSQGLRPSGNPAFTTVEEAVAAAITFLNSIAPHARASDDEKPTEAKDTSTEKPRSESEASDATVGLDLNALGVKWVTGRPPLISAVADKGDRAEVSRILSSGEADIDAVDAAEGYTALHYAAWDGRHQIVALLLDHSAKVDPLGNDGRTPLQLATANGHTECVRLLLDKGAEPDRRIKDANKYHSKNGGTALRDAVLNQFWDVYDLLLARGADIKVLAEPCVDGTDFLTAAKAVAQQYPDVGARYDATRMEQIRENLGQKGAARTEKSKGSSAKGSSVDGYLARWQTSTERYDTGILRGRLPAWTDQLSAACPDLTAEEGAAIVEAVKSRKLIPILSYAPKPFLEHTKRVWWIVPLVVWKEEVLSWLMMDKNAFYAPHPGSKDIAPIASYDRIARTEIEEDESGLDRLTLYYDNDSFLTIDGYIPDGAASWLRIAHAILEVRQPTIEASRGKPSWKEGAGGEGYLEFEHPEQLKDLNHWQKGEVSRPDPRFFV